MQGNFWDTLVYAEDGGRWTVDGGSQLPAFVKK